MTDTKTLTDLVRGGGTVSLTVTATSTNLDVEEMVLAAQQEQATVVHNRLAEQVASWRRELYAMRAELGGEPAPQPRPSSPPLCPMPGRMRVRETLDAVWLGWIAPGKPMDLDNVEAVRVPVSATDTDEQLAATAEQWLTGYGCPPSGTVEWITPQLRQHRDQLATD
ncbi:MULTISPECIES: hypothetical protein [Tsukamurella]|uniref:Uncharacterized protein n=2 Tax=Tsukamurella TaxID=2060 RepID=A0A5C5RZ82_9ACTN|nr:MULTISPECIES: hypothetical protein [Tsukamurella]NMD56553.1 hypothetical protein [Tsukamurella columbiensis]TWS27515.1 hypothetical protein FK530_18535 [Tsukamurella conjunctivitidis]